MGQLTKSFKSTVFRYYVFIFLRDFAFFSAVLIPFFTDWGHISLTQVQILQSWFMLWIFVLEIPTGAVADYLGRKYSLALGAFMIVFSTLIYGSIPKFEVFLFAEFLFAIGAALTSGADEALLYDALKEEGLEAKSKEIFGKAHAFHLLGIMVAAPIGGIMAQFLGIESPMLLSAIPFFAAALVALSIKEPRTSRKTSESRRYLTIVRSGFTYFYKHPKLRLLALDGIVVASSAYFVIWLYQPLLTSAKVPIAYFGIFHALLVAAEVLIAANFTRLEKFFGGGKNYLRLTAVVTALSFILTAIIPNLITTIIFVVIAGGFGLTRMELMGAYMNRFIPSGERATVLSSISMFKRLALVFLNPFVGFTADHSLRLALLFVGVLPLLVFLFSPLEQRTLETTTEEY